MFAIFTFLMGIHLATAWLTLNPSTVPKIWFAVCYTKIPLLLLLLLLWTPLWIEATGKTNRKIPYVLDSNQFSPSVCVTVCSVWMNEWHRAREMQTLNLQPFVTYTEYQWRATTERNRENNNETSNKNTHGWACMMGYREYRGVVWELLVSPGFFFGW